MSTKPRLAVTVGDPAGIGPEIALKALADPAVHELADLVLVGSRFVLMEQANHFSIAVEFVPPESASSTTALPVADVSQPLPGNWEFGKIRAECGEASAAYLTHAAEMARDGLVDGIVTGPINKEALQAASFPHAGHTEALGAFFNTDVETMFVVDKLRIFFLTRHVSLRQAVDLVTKERVVHLLRHVKVTLEAFGVEEPAIAVAGLNPHSGEHGLFGNEEMLEITPGVEFARDEGINAVGPVPADSVFHQAVAGKYDAVIALYHDQGHIAAKMHDFFRTVSVTTGLPTIRTSVDHGTAFDIAGRGIADHTSMTEAIRVAAEFVRGRRSTGTQERSAT